MKRNTAATSYPEIIIPVKRGILKIPMNSPYIKIINKQILENNGVDWQQLVDSKKIIIFLDDIFSLTTIVQQLLDYGQHDMTKISIYGFDDQNKKKILEGRFLNIEHLKSKKKMMRLEMVIVGDLNIFTQNGYFKRRPLWGKKIVVTRARIQSYELVRRLESFGADVFQFPLMDIKSSTDYDVMQEVFKKIKNYQWIIFGLNMSVDYFIAYLLGSGYGLNCLQDSKICALSLEAVEGLTDLGIDLHYLPSSYNLDLDKVIAGLKKSGINQEQPILILAGQDRGKMLAEKLMDLQLEVHFIPVVKLECTEINQEKLDKLFAFLPVDLWIFNMSTGIKNFGPIWRRIDSQFKKSIIAAIGPKTSEALEKEGIAVDIMPKELTIPNLVDAIIDYYDNQENNNPE